MELIEQWERSQTNGIRDTSVKSVFAGAVMGSSKLIQEMSTFTRKDFDSVLKPKVVISSNPDSELLVEREFKENPLKRTLFGIPKIDRTRYLTGHWVKDNRV